MLAKHTCPVCGRKVIYVKITKNGNKTTHIAVHEGDEINGTVIKPSEISGRYRKVLRDRMPHVVTSLKPVFDATGMNRIVMITDVINILKDRGMDDIKAASLRKEMLAKGNGFEEDISMVAPYITIVRN